VVQIKVTPKTRNPFTIGALSISGVTWEWHFLNHASPPPSAPARSGRTWKRARPGASWCRTTLTLARPWPRGKCEQTAPPGGATMPACRSGLIPHARRLRPQGQSRKETSDALALHRLPSHPVPTVHPRLRPAPGSRAWRSASHRHLRSVRRAAVAATPAGRGQAGPGCRVSGCLHSRMGMGQAVQAAPARPRDPACARWKAASISTHAATSAGTGERPPVQRRTVVCKRPVCRASSRSGQPITARQTSSRCGDMGTAAALGSASGLPLPMRDAGSVCSN